MGGEMADEVKTVSLTLMETVTASHGVKYRRLSRLWPLEFSVVSHGE